MKLVILRGNLKEALSSLERIISSTQNLPILKNVLIETEEDRVQLSATNLEVALSCTVSGKSIEKGKTTVPLTLFSSLIGTIPTERLTLELADGKMLISTDNYEATIQTLPAEEFPLIPKINNPSRYLEVSQGTLKEALTQVSASAQASELRPELGSVLFEYGIDSLKLVATDSFRLSEKTLPVGSFTAHEEDEFRILVPLKTIHELSRLLKEEGKIKIFRDENQILFQAPHAELISRLVQGAFPDYHAILPKKFDAEITASREELEHGVRLAGIFGVKASEIRIRLAPTKKHIEIYSADQQLGENVYRVSAKIQGSAEEMSFNAKYLLDGLRAIRGEEIFWGINAENRPALLKSVNESSYFYVLMPILRA